MATQAKVDSQQQEADALIIAGAAITGAADGTRKVIENKLELTKKLIQPGDQRHISHPLDDLVTDTKNLVSDATITLNKLKEAGDMRIENQPHPVDNALNARDKAISATTNTFEAQGIVEGTKTLSSIVAAAITENASSSSLKTKITNAIKIVSPLSGKDLTHLATLPQLPSEKMMEKLKQLSDEGKDVELVKTQMSTVLYGWAAFGGGSAVAAGIVLAKRDAERAEKIAQLPINEQKAIAFQTGHSNEKVKAASLEKFQELKTAYQAYDEAVAVAFKKFPEPSNHIYTFEGQYGGGNLKLAAKEQPIYSNTLKQFRMQSKRSRNSTRISTRKTQ